MYYVHVTKKQWYCRAQCTILHKINLPKTNSVHILSTQTDIFTFKASTVTQNYVLHSYVPHLALKEYLNLCSRPTNAPW